MTEALENTDQGVIGAHLQGALQAHLRGFEARPGQREMIAAVDRAIVRGEDLVVEAGTGTGKTLAYLLPILTAGCRAIVATATKQLQNQVMEHDVPVAVAATGATIDATVLKGRANYICLHRLHGELNRNALRTAPLALRAVEDASLHSDTGDIGHVRGVDENDPVWPRVTSTSDNCLGGECPSYEDCFVLRARRRALAADLVIVNHHVLLADYALRERWDGAMLLPGADVIVVDEAHALPDVAVAFFGVTLSTRRTARLCSDLNQLAAELGGEAGRVVGDITAALIEALRPLWQAADGREGQAVIDEKLFARLIKPRDAVSGVLHNAWQRLGAKNVSAASNAVGKARDVIEDLERDLHHVIARPEDDSDGEAMVRWVQRRRTGMAFIARPADCGPILRRTLLAEKATRVFTSATLAIKDDFSAFTTAAGLTGETEQLRLPGGYNYENQALLYVPGSLPSPWESGRDEALAREIARLVDAAGGGAFALFTSRRGMRDAYHRLADRLPMTAMMQGQAGRSQLLSRFAAEQPAVLFATMGFWQGVDLPGDLLRLVILDKVPFPPPDDPLFAARSKRLEASGSSSFARLSIPAAATMLRQGFGRLIRSHKDRGVVAILDPRLTRKGYGRRLLGSLPPARRTASFVDVQAFFLKPA